MVNGTHRDAIGHHWFPTLRVLPDVCGIEKFGMPKPAESALSSVGGQHPAAEIRLVNAPPYDTECVLPSSNLIGSTQQHATLPVRFHSVVERDHELVLVRLLINEPDWEQGFI